MGRLGQLKGVHCPTAAPEIINRGTIIKMFAAAFGKLPRHGRNTTSAHQTHTHSHIHIHISRCMTWYQHVFVVVGAFN